MSDTQEATSMIETLQFLIGSDIPAPHKNILIEMVTQALTMHREVRSRVATVKQPDQDWQLHEIKIVADFLREKTANSWQQADEVAMRLAAELHRDPADVRKKAIELGFGVGIDYGLAKMRNLVEDGRV